MAQRQRHREIPSENRAAEHLANERTFLAWMRTTIALISLGFVLAGIGPWLTESGTHAPHLITRAWPVGMGLVIFGALLTLLAAWRYDAVNREIEAGFDNQLSRTFSALSSGAIGFTALGEDGQCPSDGAGRGCCCGSSFAVRRATPSRGAGIPRRSEDVPGAHVESKAHRRYSNYRQPELHHAWRLA